MRLDVVGGWLAHTNGDLDVGLIGESSWQVGIKNLDDFDPPTFGDCFFLLLVCTCAHTHIFAARQLTLALIDEIASSNGPTCLSSR